MHPSSLLVSIGVFESGSFESLFLNTLCFSMSEYGSVSWQPVANNVEPRSIVRRIKHGSCVWGAVGVWMETLREMKNDAMSPNLKKGNMHYIEMSCICMYVCMYPCCSYLHSTNLAMWWRLEHHIWTTEQQYLSRE